jgi:hypothetical protein
VITNAIFAAYIPIYVLVPLCAIPIVIMVIFGGLAYRNIRQTIVLAAQQADRQLMNMILIQVILVVISMTPFGIYMTYDVITSQCKKDLDQQLKESFVVTILVLITYFYYVVCVDFIR